MTEKKSEIKIAKPSGEFFDSVAALIEQARAHVGRTADRTMCVTYFEIGRMIVEEEQGGKARAEYGSGLLKELSAYLKSRVGKGFSISTLRNARQFYQTYVPSIQQTMFNELPPVDDAEKQQTMFSVFEGLEKSQKRQSYPFALGWSHYLILMRIDNPDERRFYEIEAARQQWSFRRLQHEYGSSLYERLALSRDKDKVMKLSKYGQMIEQPRDILKNPLVLDFLDMEERAGYDEDDLETAIIDKLEQFLLEMGKGFLFEARQKRFTFNEKHFRVDLVLYNRLLRCYVLIDLKTGILQHQDLGQMQMYVHYFDRHIIVEDENPTVGILLCHEKDNAIVELTLPDGENIYATEYSLYLPEKALLQRKFAEWTQEFEDAQEAMAAAQAVAAEDED
jgi:predicted nuclease of restriction endonuclease-like (RecB) superfamily